MPYFVYLVRPLGQLQVLGEHAAFKHASAQAKAERAARAGAKANEAVRVMFAATAQEAEDLLLRQREPHPPGDE